MQALEDAVKDAESNEPSVVQAGEADRVAKNHFLGQNKKEKNNATRNARRAIIGSSNY